MYEDDYIKLFKTIRMVCLSHSRTHTLTSQFGQIKEYAFMNDD